MDATKHIITQLLDGMHSNNQVDELLIVDLLPSRPVSPLEGHHIYIFIYLSSIDHTIPTVLDYAQNVYLDHPVDISIIIDKA